MSEILDEKEKVDDSPVKSAIQFKDGVEEYTLSSCLGMFFFVLSLVLLLLYFITNRPS